MTKLNILCLATLFAASQLRGQTTDPASVNRVLDLDGTNSWVELPPDLFTNDVITVEGWVKWREFGNYSRFFPHRVRGW